VKGLRLVAHSFDVACLLLVPRPRESQGAVRAVVGSHVLWCLQRGIHLGDEAEADLDGFSARFRLGGATQDVADFVELPAHQKPIIKVVFGHQPPKPGLELLDGHGHVKGLTRCGIGDEKFPGCCPDSGGGLLYLSCACPKAKEFRDTPQRLGAAHLNAARKELLR
jgi:hypothetical protein